MMIPANDQDEFDNLTEYEKGVADLHRYQNVVDQQNLNRAAWNQVIDEQKPGTPSSIQFLERAADLQRERAKQYDVGGTMAGERSMGKAVAAFNIIAGRNLQESEGWLLLQILKDVRDRTGNAHLDSLEDCVAYAALKAEARIQGK